MKTQAQALAEIAKLVNDQQTPDVYYSIPRLVRAILADVQSEPAPQRVSWRNTAGVPEPAPAGGTIDRDALREQLAYAMGYEADTWSTDVSEAVDAVLALVRPVEGVVLSREDAGRVLDWFYAADPTSPFDHDDRSLAKRLEPAS